MAQRVILHGHFYQPPRADPVTGQIEKQPSAAPFHDWNERIHAECYGPNTEAHIPTEVGELVVNNFERLSFDVGPTLLMWLERAHPETYSRIVEADRRSIDRLGHGNAMAQSFHHTILPLADERDARTQIRWGLADFRYRFGRHARGMWLPEAAVTPWVLDLLIDEGIEFTVLAPNQASRVREPDGEWLEAREALDPRLPYRYVRGDDSDRSLTLFFYDGGISHSLAFDNLASSAERLIGAFEKRAGDPEHVVHVATDGETYGHHFRFGDLGLAYALFTEAEAREIEIINYEAWLSSGEVRLEAEVATEGSAWSCAHGVGRWERDCGCSTGGDSEWNQEWRRPLRDAFDLVREVADDAYVRLSEGLLGDPWGARDRYVDVVIGRTEPEEFVYAEAGRPTAGKDLVRALRLLNLQENAMSMYTSCGWFFSDIGGIESMQVMRYARRALDLLEELGVESPREPFLAKLAEAKSNDPELGTGADIFTTLAE